MISRSQRLTACSCYYFEPHRVGRRVAAYADWAKFKIEDQAQNLSGKLGPMSGSAGRQRALLQLVLVIRRLVSSQFALLQLPT